MSVEFHHVTKRFTSTPVVDDLSMKIQDGEFVVLLGPSGCGKTTTLRLLAGLEEVSSGDIFVCGERVNDLPPQQRDMAMVFQSYALYPHMTVAENIAYPLRVRKLSANTIKAQVEQVAAMLEIHSLLQRKPRELSGGERQRVALARAIVRQPRVFLMDEPLSNLDARLRLQMRGELKHLQRELGTTTVYVTHDQAEAMTLGHRVAVMKSGKLQQFDTPLTIYNHPANRFVAEFVGSPGMNFLDGRVDRSTRRFLTDGYAIPLTESQLEHLSTMGYDQKLTMGIRPNHLQVSVVDKDGSLPATVYVTELMGSESFVFLDFGKDRLIVRAPAEFRADAGDKVNVTFQIESAHFFDTQSGMRL
jgi:multiple sugar transport system ATP-binding protein